MFTIGIELVVVLGAGLLGAIQPLLKLAVEATFKNNPAARRYFDSSFGKVVLRALGVEQTAQPAGVKDLFAELTKTSAAMDRIVADIGGFTRDREAAVTRLEGDLETLSRREVELKARIEGLEKVPLPAAEYFAKLVEKTEKRSAKRDYLLFLSGVVVSALLAIILKKAFGL
jgi:hypothetical protein